MSWLKGPDVGGRITINDNINFTGSVLARSFNNSPWGTIYYVDGINGNDDYNGLTPERAKATIQAAVTASTADTTSRSDIIYVNPHTWNTGTGFTRYTEDVTITSGVSSTDMTNSNMSIVGISSNGATGDFLGVRWKHNSTCNLTNDAPALHVENIGFYSEGATYGVHLVHDGASLTKQGSQGTSFYNCAFKGKGLYVLSGGDGLTVDRCRFQCNYDGTVAQLNYSASANPGRRLTVRNCEWLDGNGVVSSAACIAIAPPLTEILIRDCYFPQVPTGNAYITDTGASCEGLIANCYVASANIAIGTAFPVTSTLLTVGIYDETGLVVA